MQHNPFDTASLVRRLPPGLRGRAPSGMTLIEIMIVLVIIAALIVGGVLVFNDVTRANLKAQTLRVSGVIKYAYGQAAIRQQYHRLVIDIDSSEYWLEVADQEGAGGPPEIPQESYIGAPERAQAPPSRPTSGYASDDAEGSVFGLQRPSYAEAGDMVVKRRKLENNIKFHSVYTPQAEEPVTSGKATITFFPSGFVERSQIVLSDGGDGFMTMELAPLTGKVTLLSGKHEIPRDFHEVEEDD